MAKIEDILVEADCLINGERADTYGTIEENWTRIGIMWGAILNIDAIEPATVGLMMAAVKISRAVADPTHVDNYIDGCAYLAGSGELSSEI